MLAGAASKTSADGPVPRTLAFQPDEERAVTLREIQAPIKARYEDDPDTARITLRATGAIADGAMSCSSTNEIRSRS
jgi:hypothetical protein